MKSTERGGFWVRSLSCEMQYWLLYSSNMTGRNKVISQSDRSLHLVAGIPLSFVSMLGRFTAARSFPYLAWCSLPSSLRTAWLAAYPMPGLLQAIAAQDCMGWLAFFEWCIAVEWAGVQEAHFIWLGRCNTSKQRPLLSTLLSSLHYIDAWLLWVQTACSRKDRRDEDALNPAMNTAKDNLPSMNDPRCILQQFLSSTAQP
jgi:hypothetical protein